MPSRKKPNECVDILSNSEGVSEQDTSYSGGLFAQKDVYVALDPFWPDQVSNCNMSFERNDSNRLGEKLKFICTIEDALPMTMLKILIIGLLTLMGLLIAIGICFMGRHLLVNNDDVENRPNEVDNDNEANEQRDQA